MRVFTYLACILTCFSAVAAGQESQFEDFIRALHRDTALLVYSDDFNQALDGLEKFPLFEGDIYESILGRFQDSENAEEAIARLEQLNETYETIRNEELINRVAFVIHTLDDKGSINDWSLLLQFKESEKSTLLEMLSTLVGLTGPKENEGKEFRGKTADDFATELSKVLGKTVECSISDTWFAIGTSQTYLDALAKSPRSASPKSLAANRAVIGIRNRLKKLHRESESFFFFCKPDIARKLVPMISDENWESWKIDSAGAGGCVLFREEQPGIVLDCVLSVRMPVKGLVADLDNYHPVGELPSSFKTATRLFATNLSVEPTDKKPPEPEDKTEEKETAEKRDDFDSSFERLSEKHNRLASSEFSERYVLRVKDKNNMLRHLTLLKAKEDAKVDEFVENNVELLNLFRKGFEITEHDINGLVVWAQDGKGLRKQIASAGKRGRFQDLLSDEDFDWDADPAELWKAVPADGILNLGDWVLIGDANLSIQLANIILGQGEFEGKGIDHKARLAEFSKLISLDEPLVLSMSDSRNSLPIRLLATHTFHRVMGKIAKMGETTEEREKMREDFIKRAVFPKGDGAAAREEALVFAGLAILTAYDSQLSCVSKLQGNAVRLSIGLYVDEKQNE